jgi:hypothetical protein
MTARRRRPARAAQRCAALIVASVMASVVLPANAPAQQRDTTATNGLPRDVAREVVALYNATTTLRATDRVEIPADSVLRGDVAVLDGPVVVAGRITGRLLAINADVLLRKGARIDGDLLVVGGEVEGSEGATIGGELRVYHPPLRYTRESDQLVAVTEEQPIIEQWWRRFELGAKPNSNRLEIASAGAYNRTEGLPVKVGPVLYRDQGWGHLRLSADAILRTGSSFSSATADVGHLVRGEVRVGRRYGVTMAGELFDVVNSVEDWHLSDMEAGLAAFVFRRDYRDYYERHGGRLAAELRATDNADLTLSYGDERWGARPARNPPTLFNGEKSWRDNPVLDAGHLHRAEARLRIDTRNDTFNPLTGWYVIAEYERSSGVLTTAGPTSPGVRLLPAGDTRYQRGFLDVRRYNRLAPNAALNVRGVLGGWLGGDPLPLERRLSIDGPGTIPGFDFRAGSPPDVGTCSAGAAVPGRPAQCERIALAQLEYRKDLRLSLSDELSGGRGARFRADGAWVFFADAGRGWLVNAPGSPLDIGRDALPALSTYRTDIGAGVDFTVLGLYVAKALSSPKEPMNVFIRLRHRF